MQWKLNMNDMKYECTGMNALILNLLPGLRIRIFNLVIKVLSCVLYVVRAALDDVAQQKTALANAANIVNW